MKGLRIPWRLLFCVLVLGNLCSRVELRGASGLAQTNAVPPVVVARTEDSLTLLNGDRLQGRLVGVDGGGVLTWQHKAMLAPLRCRLAALDKVELSPRKCEGVEHHRHLAQLVNGDRLSGDVVTLDANQLVLRTWYAGMLTIAHSRLAALTPVAGPFGVLYDGPSADLAGWSMDEADQAAPGLAFRKGALVLSGGRRCGRNIPHMPAKARFDLELGNGHDADFSFSFFSDDPGGMISDAYSLNFAGGGIDFRRMAGEDRSLGAMDLSEQLAGRKRTHVTILADRQERYFALLLNSRLVDEFRDEQEFKGKGEHLAFMNNNATGLRIYRLTVAPWNGRLPRAGSEDGTAVEQDTLTLANGDNIVGTVRSIARGLAKFETSYGTLDVPLASIASLRFANTPGPTNGTVRCYFNEQDAVTMALEKLAGESATGTAEGIGPLHLPLGALTRLEFNPGASRAAEDDDER
jgi:hypothetical protein